MFIAWKSIICIPVTHDLFFILTIISLVSHKHTGIDIVVFYVYIYMIHIYIYTYTLKNIYIHTYIFFEKHGKISSTNIYIYLRLAILIKIWKISELVNTYCHIFFTSSTVAPLKGTVLSKKHLKIQFYCSLLPGKMN